MDARNLIRGLALALLLVVAGASAQDPPPYDRKEWGSWRSTGEHGPNGCRWNSRGAALREAAEVGSLVVRDEPGEKCLVLALEFVDPYTGDSYKGEGRRVHVDHLVALAEAHRSGASAWSSEDKRDFFNDSMNHVPALDRVNSSKSDRDPGGERGAPWLPPDPAARCWYAQTYVAVKAKWGLTADDSERQALDEIRCEE